MQHHVLSMCVMTNCVADAVLKEEQLSRIRLFFGDEGLALVESAFVVVVGLGGVGTCPLDKLAYLYLNYV